MIPLLDLWFRPMLPAILPMACGQDGAADPDLPHPDGGIYRVASDG